MSSVVDICNRALQRLGANSITSITGDSTEARECNRCYGSLRDAELRANIWAFAKTRVQLAASTTVPLFEFANAFPLPSDYLRLIRSVDDLDWQVETDGDVKILLTDDDAPLDFRYVRQVTNTGLFDPLFVESLSARMAKEMAEKLTQSNKKREFAHQEYKLAIAEAKKVNAIERPPRDAVEDDWFRVRL